MTDDKESGNKILMQTVKFIKGVIEDVKPVHLIGVLEKLVSNCIQRKALHRFYDVENEIV